MKELLAFPVTLERSHDSDTVGVRYSADMGLMLGCKGAHLGIYVKIPLPIPFPSTLTVMFYAADPEDLDEERRVVEELGRRLEDERGVLAEPATVPVTFSGEKSETFRYDPTVPVIGTIYFPRKLFSGKPPKTCYVELKLPPRLRRADAWIKR